MKKARDSLPKTLRKGFLALPHPTLKKMDPSKRYCCNPILRWNPQVEEYFIKAYGADHFSRVHRVTLVFVSTRSRQQARMLLRSYWQSYKIQGRIEDAMKASSQNRMISNCQIPGLEYVVFVQGSGPHTIAYGFAPDRPPKEVIVSRKCAEAFLRGTQVYVPGVMACSSHVKKGDTVAVAVEQPWLDGGWGIGITHGTVIQGLQTGRICEECGMGQEEINALVVGLRIQKVLVLTALIESFLMLSVLLLVYDLDYLLERKQ